MNFNKDDNSTHIRFTPGREDKYSTSADEVGTRPVGDPKSSKNFQKILRKDPDKEKDGEDNLGAIDEEEGAQSAMVVVEEQALKELALKKKQAPTSLFELSSGASKATTKAYGSQLNPTRNHAENKFIADSKKDALAANDGVSENVPESPAELFSKKITTKEPKKIEVHIEQTSSTDQPVNVSQPVKVEEKKDKINSRFATEQPDLSYVNPLALNTHPVQSTNFNTEKPILPSINIQEIINQLVDKVVQMETGGHTDTVVTLKRPPILAGADLVVTGFDTAKGEFNITFQKLSQAAKTLLDMHANQQSLLLALEQKGYAVHIITTTTLAEINLPGSAATPQDRNRNQDQPEQDQSGKSDQQRQPEKQR